MVATSALDAVRVRRLILGQTTDRQGHRGQQRVQPDECGVHVDPHHDAIGEPGRHHAGHSPDDGETECHRVDRGQALVHVRVQPDDHDDHRDEKEQPVEEELLPRRASPSARPIRSHCSRRRRPYPACSSLCPQQQCGRCSCCQARRESGDQIAQGGARSRINERGDASQVSRVDGHPPGGPRHR